MHSRCASQGIGPIALCLNRLTLRGFIVWDYKEQWGDFIKEVGPCCGIQGKRLFCEGDSIALAVLRVGRIYLQVGGLVKTGKLKYREDIAQGLETAPK